MKLSSYLDSNLIFTDIEGKSKDEIIRNIIDKTAKKDEKFNKRKEEIKKAVLEREHEISTAMGRGIAIPHARVEGYDDFLISIGIVKNPLYCELTTKEEGCVDIFFLIAAGQTKNKIMLKTMSAITKLAIKTDLLEIIQKEKDPNYIMEIIKKANIEVSERIVAEDVMDKNISPASLDDTLEEIAKRFVIESPRGIPVLDKKGKFIGEITRRELIQYGMPKYTSLMDDLSFMTYGEPFEEYFKNEKKVKIREIYRKNPICVDRNASIMEISFLMVTKGNTRIYVVENGVFYGLILREDIIKKVLHI